ncbi:hypothetical protein CH373_02045 [Leptospira perolatii]|uniref:Lcl C-terminal domain-containing protein n=1 Tax=Leptospira perolatii TaxID=2023191 RepID=A0A2M9ZS05_9LEPT|nr:DUF1566 domain-containing protein [Leptospira perolatii]PJZ71308.1 hypothetical protein CH360_02045 [Leptospira perolatii]PJZ74842.1 hypothetical protein CH373_02045 [Leptospira perolatii]
MKLSLISFLIFASVSCNKATALNLDSSKSPIGLLLDSALASAGIDQTVIAEANNIVGLSANQLDYGGWYNASPIKVMRCSHGQDLADPNCAGSVTKVEFCTVNDHSCNGGDSSHQVQTGPLFKVCDDLNKRNNGIGFGGTNTWRVPTCRDFSSAGNDCELFIFYQYFLLHQSQFPNTEEDLYWSAEPSSFPDMAYAISFSTTTPTPYATTTPKLNKESVRCVSGGSLSHH